MTDRRLFFIILAFYLVLATTVSVIVPLGESPDEADHYAYARYLALNRALPEGPEVTQGKHPPLYYGLAALVGGWTGMKLFLQPNPDVFPIRPDGPANFFIHVENEAFPWKDGPLAFHLARFLSVLFGAVTLFGAWRIGQEAFPERRDVGLLAAAFLAALPGFLYISGSMNNDNAAAAFGSLIILIMVRMIQKGMSWMRTFILGLLLGLGLLSKVGVLSLWPLLVFPLLGGLWSHRRAMLAWLTMAGHGLVAWGLGVLVASPWLLRNWRLYGDPLGWELVRQTVDIREGPVDFAVLVWLVKGLYTYFWGRFGAIGQIWLPGWAYVMAAFFLILIVSGIFIFLKKWWKGTFHQAMLFLLLLGAPFFILSGIINYTRLALGTDQARLLWPSIAVIGVWFAIGLAGLSDMTTISQRLSPPWRVLVILGCFTTTSLMVFWMLNLYFAH